MVTTGDPAPDFTAPLAYGDDEIGSITLSTQLDQAPIILAFFPAAFTHTCSHEMQAFQQRLTAFADASATIYGISIDPPFAQNAFREQLGLEFGLISDVNRKIVNQYDVAMDWAAYEIDDIAKRAVFVIDSDGMITYTWRSEDLGIEPDYDEILTAVSATNS